MLKNNIALTPYILIYVYPIVYSSGTNTVLVHCSGIPSQTQQCLLLVKLCPHKVSCQGPLSLDVSRSSTLALVANVHQDLRCVLRHLQVINRN